ncbi:hypothetical protein EBR66_07670 [bacterium]|nr:hypothetical protein [bacterium]
MKRRSKHRNSRRIRPRKYRGGGTVDVYFKMDGTGAISNVYSTNSSLTVTPAGVGKVNINTTIPTTKLSGIVIQGMLTPSSTWPADTALTTATGYTGTKLVLAKGSSSLTSTTPTGFKFNSGGTTVSGANLNISNMFGTAVWGTKNPDVTGAPPPGAPSGTAAVNTRIRFTVV